MLHSFKYVFIHLKFANWFLLEQEPNVVRLPIHLPNQQQIIFNPLTNADQLLQSRENVDTPLMAFFKMNCIAGDIGDLARSLLYQEYPQHFVVKTDPHNPQSKVWHIRQRQCFAIGRMVYVNPTAGERFYLRTLLMVLRGPQSFEDLKTFNGEICETFHDACLKRGLLEDDGEWRICLQEASEIETGSQLRHLFTTLLLFCSPSQPKTLWLTFRDKICDDVRYRLNRLGRNSVSESDISDYGLHLIDTILHDSGHSLSDFPSMPQPRLDWFTTTHNRLISQQLNYDVHFEEEMTAQFSATLNNDQRDAFQTIWQSIINKEGKSFFVDGFGGCGKTYLYQTICHAVRARGIIVLSVASTGLASLLLPGGQTAHSIFKIPIDTLDSNSTCPIPKQSLCANLLQLAEVVIYDECLMNHRYCFEAMDRTFQDLRDNPKPFGGLTMIFGSDFQQILPVIPKGSRADIVEASLRTSYLWNHMHVLKLRENMRLKDSPQDSHFAQWLLDIGHGRTLDDNNQIDVPPSMVLHDEDDLINAVFPDIHNIQHHPSPALYFLEHAILAPRNEDVHQTNQKILDKMQGPEIVCDSADSLENEGEGVRDDIPEDFLRSLEPSSLPLSQLKMKIGCPLMLLRNLDPAKGLCNGTRMILLQAYPRLLEVMIIGNEHHGEKAFIPRITLKPTSQQFPFIIKRRQFPVRLSFAMTINKAQGQSLKYVGIHLLSSVFCHGQLYVAFSRATSSENVHVLLPHSQGTKTLNIVYPEVLL